MVDVSLFKVTQSGDIGGDGLSRFAVTNSTGTGLTDTEAAAAADAIMGMYVALAAQLQAGVTWVAPTTYQVVRADSGALIGEFPVAGTIASATGSTGADAPAGVGARGYWHTNTIKNRRFVRGATFFSPFQAGAYGGSGSLSSATVTAVLAAMNGYLTAAVVGGFIPMIWSRPKTLTSLDGSDAPIIGVSCTSVPGSLRSRRF